MTNVRSPFRAQSHYGVDTLGGADAVRDSTLRDVIVPTLRFVVHNYMVTTLMSRVQYEELRSILI